jgi:hypothetical protein
MTFATIEGRRLNTKLSEGDYYSEQSERSRLSAAEKGSALLRDAILLAKGIVPLPLKGRALPLPPLPEPCELCGAPKKPRTMIADIQATVAGYYGLPAQTMKSHQQYRRVARPRQIAMFLADELTPHSLSEIGRRFDRDHTTVMHALKTVRGLIETDAEVLIDVEVLRERLGA